MHAEGKPLIYQRKRASTEGKWTPFDVDLVGWGLLNEALKPLHSLTFWNFK